MGNDATIGFAASQGNFELNVFKPVIIYNLLQSTRLLADSITAFNDKCAVGIEPNHEKIQYNLQILVNACDRIESRISAMKMRLRLRNSRIKKVLH